MTGVDGAIRGGRSMRATRIARRLLGAVAALAVTDLVGGLLAVATGINTWSEAWGGKALLAAPVPMVVLQVVLAGLAARLAGKGAAVAAGLLSAACLVSVASGFFDGGIGNEALTPALSVYQAFLLAVTAVVGVLASFRTVEAWREPR